MRRMLLLTATALAGCETDALTRPPLSPPSAATVPVPLRDALERIIPALGPSQEATEIQHLVLALGVQPDPAALTALESALRLLVETSPDLGPEADAIRLAVAAQP